jgi:hypothetical protein
LNLQIKASAGWTEFHRALHPEGNASLLPTYIDAKPPCYTVLV